MTAGDLAGELLCKDAGQIADHLLSLLLGDVPVFNGAVVIGTVVDQRARVGQRAAQKTVGGVDGAAALLLIQPLAEGLALVQKYVVVDQYGDAQAAQNSGQTEEQCQKESGQLGPGLIYKSFHEREPSIL